MPEEEVKDKDAWHLMTDPLFFLPKRYTVVSPSAYALDFWDVFNTGVLGNLWLSYYCF